MVAGTVALVALLLGGCGGAGNGQPQDERANAAAVSRSDAPLELKVSLDGWMGAATAGLLTAEARGYFDDAGLNVWLGTAYEPRAAVPQVLEETDDLGVVRLPQAILAKSKGAPVVVLGSVIAQPTEAMIWLRSAKIGSVSDLEGKTIAIPGDQYQEEFLRSVLAQAGLTLRDVTLDRAAYRLVPALLDGSADATFGGSGNLEGAELEAEGARSTVVGFRSLGIPDYEPLILIARANLVAEHPEEIREFMAAVARGTTTAQWHSDAAAKAVAESAEKDPEVTEAGMQAQLDATLPLLSPGDSLDLDRTQSLIDWMEKEGMLTQSFPADALVPDGAAE
jgi:putative hydroxymethylpyrimidine transport system substrate-binding protein